MDARRSIPSVERLLTHDAFAALVATAPRTLIAELLQGVQDVVRAEPADHPAEWYAHEVAAGLSALRSTSLKRVINATGVVLHTNLGRAPLADEAIAAVQAAAAGYTTLEYDVARGRRGSRYDHCARLLRQLTGAGDALVVNNNAAAVVLALNTFSRGKSAIVSRGELVEIGGSFRVPDIMARSGARLLEVGSTNRTHPDDYDNAIDARTGVLLKVHRSNFSIEGYTADVAAKSLAGIARRHGIPLVYDMGSGVLDHAEALGLIGEPTARGVLDEGVSVVTLSGDKLLGGPQSGILLGDAERIAAMRKNPLCRALRVDKLTLAALEATLILHLDTASARTRIPTLRMLTMSLAEIAPRANAIAARLGGVGIEASCVHGESAAGGGAVPGKGFATVLVRVAPTKRMTAAKLERAMRTAVNPVVARIDNDAVVIDLRTVLDAEEDTLVNTIADAFA